MSIATSDAEAAPRPRRWFRRNWKWFLPALFVVSVVLAAVAVFSYVQVRAYRYRQNSAYQIALAAVQESREVQKRLGDPIVDADWNPQGGYERDEDGAIRGARFNFTVSGPKASADVAVSASQISGEWAVNSLHVRFANDEQMNLTQQVLDRQKIDTPKFDAGAEKPSPSKQHKDGSKPPAEVNVEVPQVPPGIK